MCAQGMNVHVQLCACKLCKCVCKLYDLGARARAIAGAQALQVSARKSAVVIGALSAEGSLATLPAFFDVDFDRPPLFDKYESESR